MTPEEPSAMSEPLLLVDDLVVEYPDRKSVV